MNSTAKKIIVAALFGLIFGGGAAVGGAIMYPDLPAIAQVGLLLSGFGLGAVLGLVADWVVTVAGTAILFLCFLAFFLWIIYHHCLSIFQVVRHFFAGTSYNSFWLWGFDMVWEEGVPTLTRVVIEAGFSTSAVVFLILVLSRLFLLISAVNGNASAQFKFGKCYATGTRFFWEKNITKAKEWLNKAAAQGHTEAQKLLDELEKS